jgi:hypothetical protein
MMMFAGRIAALRWGAVLALALVAGVAQGQEVRICVITILATERDKKVDPKLECIAKEVQRDNPTLTGFHLKDISCKSLAVGAKEEFKLIDDEVATVHVKQAADRDNRVVVSVRPPRMKEITYRTACGKFLPIMTKYRTKDGDVLLIGVQLKPCHGDKDK